MLKLACTLRMLTEINNNYYEIDRAVYNYANNRAHRRLFRMQDLDKEITGFELVELTSWWPLYSMQHSEVPNFHCRTTEPPLEPPPPPVKTVFSSSIAAILLIAPLCTRKECRITAFNSQGCSSLANPNPPLVKDSREPKFSALPGTQNQGSSSFDEVSISPLSIVDYSS